MALLLLEEDPWILEHESCDKLQRDIMGQLTERQKFGRTSSRYAQISADIRLRLKQYINEADQLRQKLDLSLSTGLITLAESERRIRQVEVLMTKATQMRKLFEDQLSQKRMQERNNLLFPGNNTIIDLNEPNNSGPSSTSNLSSVNAYRNMQKELINEQDAGLENLSKIISRQKDIANTISNEVEFHNEIIEDIDDHIDRTDQRVRSETDRIGIVDKKDKTCGYWIVIIILFISIIVVIAL